jgi:hypothetical protein
MKQGRFLKSRETLRNYLALQPLERKMIIMTALPLRASSLLIFYIKGNEKNKKLSQIK